MTQPSLLDRIPGFLYEAIIHGRARVTLTDDREETVRGLIEDLIAAPDKDIFVISKLAQRRSTS